MSGKLKEVLKIMITPKLDRELRAIAKNNDMKLSEYVRFHLQKIVSETPDNQKTYIE